MAKILCFSGSDYGIFVFGRFILAKNPGPCLTFFWQTEVPAQTEALTESDLWPQKLPESTGIMFDHHRHDIAAWGQGVPQFPTQALHHLANEGLADSVEFRRLGRKFLRRARQHNLHSIFFPEAIFGDVKIKKILQQLAGPSLKIYTIQDFWDENTFATENSTRKITIYHHTENIDFMHSQAENLLGTKLKRTDFVRI